MSRANRFAAGFGWLVIGALAIEAARVNGPPLLRRTRRWFGRAQ